MFKKKDPPKNRPFLADIGHPILVYAHYNPLDDDYCYAELQTSYSGGEEKDECYFQNDFFNLGQLIDWIEIYKQ